MTHSVPITTMGSLPSRQQFTITGDYMHTHPLEAHEGERAYFLRIKEYNSRSCMSAYRRAVIACTGNLPTWSKPQKPGRKPKVVAR
jgi:hypothetical protein